MTSIAPSICYGPAARRIIGPMPPALAHHAAEDVAIRPARKADIDAMIAIEEKVFSTDLLSRRSFARLLAAPTAELLVAELGGRPVGYAVVLYRTGSTVARLYSIAIAPHVGGRRIGALLIAAAEDAALARGALTLRLEVREDNAAAIARYGKSGYRRFGRHRDYYEDGAPALRFEKRLCPQLRADQPAPPYFHQTTEFTCGPACLMMALAWADPALRPDPALEFKLWREASTICMTSVPGGCEPYGLAVALKRRGLDPAIHVSRAGPYFLDQVRAKDARRVILLTQGEFHREAESLGIRTHLTPLAESGFMRAFDSGAVAIVLVAGYHMVRRKVPHWVFAFGREADHILVHDPAATRDEDGRALRPETYSVPWDAFERMTRVGRDDLRAAIVIRKGPVQ